MVYNCLFRISQSGKKLKKQTGKLINKLKKQALTYKECVETQNKKIADLDKRIDAQNEAPFIYHNRMFCTTLVWSY